MALRGPNEVRLCELDGVEVVLDRALASTFAGREVVIDATEDPAADGFSCEAELGFRLRLDRLPAVC